MNLKLAEKTLQQLFSQGVQDIAVCAGARNAPFIHLLEKENPFKIHSFFDERAAAFFALGVSKKKEQPCAVITTSGTAVSETYSAVIEAYYTALQLVIVSADRPKSYRGACAPQSIEQPKIFAQYANCFDIDAIKGSEFSLSRNNPTHINICFDEPLIDGHLSDTDWQQPVASSEIIENAPSKKLVQFLSTKKNPLVIVGGLSPKKASKVAAKLNTLGLPVAAEAISNFSAPQSNQIRHLEKLTDFSFDGIVRIGGVPTSRFWRDLEKNKIPTINFSDAPFSGLSWVKEQPESIDTFLATEVSFEADLSSLLEREEMLSSKLTLLLEKYPTSEQSLVQSISIETESNDDVFIGNSLPIRNWNLVTNSRARHFYNRGVNGIDGLISTAFGCASTDRRLWVVLGDLSALYDLNSLAMIPNELKDVRIFVINNGGGKIFSRMFYSPLFENRHDIRFEKWAEMFGFDYSENISKADRSARREIIELRPDPEATESFYQEWEKA